MVAETEVPLVALPSTPSPLSACDCADERSSASPHAPSEAPPSAPPPPPPPPPPVVSPLLAGGAAAALLLLAWIARSVRRRGRATKLDAATAATLAATRGAALAAVSLPPAAAPPPPAAPQRLAGLRFGVKDAFALKGRVTGFGSPRWATTHGPEAATSPVVAALQAAGARGTHVCVTDELVFSILGENTHYGTPFNPAAPGRVPGGSSSGSASLVAQARRRTRAS